MADVTHIIPNGPVLVVLVGPSGAGKSTFCAENFSEHEVVSSDYLREWFTGDFARQDKNQEVFNEFHRRIEARLSAGFRAVADATHLRDGDRKRTAEIGYMLGVPVYYVVINRSVVGKMQTGGWRNDVRIKGKTLIEAHEETFTANEAKILNGDSQKWVTVYDTRTADVKAVKPLSREDTLADLASRGFEKVRVVPDVHGNIDGLNSVLSSVNDKTFVLFLGDVTDYGNHSWPCVEIVNDMVSNGKAIMVRGNHDKKMHRYVQQTSSGKEFSGQITYGMDVSTNQLKSMHPSVRASFERQFMSLMEQTPDWVQLGNWIFAHAAIDKKMYGNTLFRSHQNSRMETMALYGETDGTKDDRGYPVRTYEWIEKMPKHVNAVLGHQILSVEAPVVKRSSIGNTVIFLDTGSSKDIDGVDGFLSYLDFTITHDRKKPYYIVPYDTFGKE